MSADRQRLTSAIRRIAKTDPEIRGLLDAADNKGGKPGSAGVGSSTDAESQRICCDGSTSGSVNPGTEERDPDSSTQSGLDSTDPANISSNDGTLSGVTDCATGEQVCFDGAGFIPPNNWDAPDDPPVDPTYVEGDFWEVSFGEGCPSFSRSATRSGAILAYLSCQTAVTGATYTITGPRTAGDSLVRYSFDVTGTRTSDGSTITYPKQVSRYNCQANQSSTPYCDPSKEDIRSTAWPTDSCVNLAIINGTIVGSKYDPENDGSYSAPRTSIDLCDSEGSQISLAPAANGGWKTINSTTNNGYLYDSSGRQIAHIDGNEYSDPSV